MTHCVNLLYMKHISHWYYNCYVKRVNGVYVCVCFAVWHTGVAVILWQEVTGFSIVPGHISLPWCHLCRLDTKMVLGTKALTLKGSLREGSSIEGIWFPLWHGSLKHYVTLTESKTHSLYVTVIWKFDPNFGRIFFSPKCEQCGIKSLGALEATSILKPSMAYRGCKRWISLWTMQKLTGYWAALFKYISASSHSLVTS